MKTDGTPAHLQSLLEALEAKFQEEVMRSSDHDLEENVVLPRFRVSVTQPYHLGKGWAVRVAARTAGTLGLGLPRLGG